MKRKICKISLFSAILASVTALPSDAAVRTKNSNRSYADAYNQVNAMRYQAEHMNATATNATTASATANLPVMVSDEKLASAILNNTSETTMEHLELCSMIYPNGVFRWEIPESGIRQNQKPQCVAVVSLVDANTNAVLATTTLAAGDAMKCNIDSFPESGMNEVALKKTLLPADVAPTMEDVVAVMNEEQKQNAGFKIAAGTIISAVAGNALAKKDAGDSGILGTGKNQIKGTAIGAVTGAGIMAASSYTGKVAGDTIKSTAVNAASGMIIGNMLAGQSSEGGILVVQNCKIEQGTAGNVDQGTTIGAISKGDHDCIAGQISEKDTQQICSFDVEGDNCATNPDAIYLIASRGNSVKKCTQNGATLKCEPFYKELVDVNVVLANGTDTKRLKDIKESDFESIVRFAPAEGSDSVFESLQGAQKDTTFYKVHSAYTVTNTKNAYIVFPKSIQFESGGLGGHKVSELEKIKSKQDYVYMYRNSDGSVGSPITTSKDKLDFTPISGNASDGGLVDLSNQARTKGTIAGAAAGGALGGFAGYQGAQSEITDRWTTAIREYQDSLSNFVCQTGTRFLSQYNDYVEIPTLKDSDQ